MENDTLLYDYDHVTNVATARTVPEEVIAIRYLGDSLEDYLASVATIDATVDNDTWNTTNTNDTAVDGKNDSATSSYGAGDEDELAIVVIEGEVITSIHCPGTENIVTNETNTATTASTNSTSNFDANATNAHKSSSETIIVSYVYEVETKNVSSADSFLPQIEQEILMELADVMMPCWAKKVRPS